MKARSVLTAAGVVGVAAGVATERIAVKRRRASDPEAGQEFGSNRGQRARWVERPDGSRLFVEEVGPQLDRALVFVHGSALRTDEWHYQFEGLGGHRLVFYDLRGHGLSRPMGEAEFSIATLADDLIAVIEDARAREVVIVGHSIGGMIAMELCRRRPDLVGDPIKGLVLANTTYRPPVETIFGGALIARLERLLRRPLDGMGGHAARIDTLRRIVRPSDSLFWGVALSSFGRRPSASQVDFVYDMLAETPSDVILSLIRSYRDFKMTDDLAGLALPVLVIGGTRDRITLPEASEYLAANLPKAELQLLEGCGHMAMLECHAEFNASVERFADDVLGKPQAAMKDPTRRKTSAARTMAKKTTPRTAAAKSRSPKRKQS